MASVVHEATLVLKRRDGEVWMIGPTGKLIAVRKGKNGFALR
jgi:hypothetical protein